MAYNGTISIYCKNLPEIEANINQFVAANTANRAIFRNLFTTMGADFARMASGYAPRRTGALEKVKRNVKSGSTAWGTYYNDDVVYMPDYAGRLETQPWGPMVGNPLRPGTARKQATVGYRMGGAYGERALAHFAGVASGIQIAFDRNFKIIVMYQRSATFGPANPRLGSMNFRTKRMSSAIFE